MNASRLVAVLGVTLFFAATAWSLQAANPPVENSASTPLNADAVLRRIELNVALKQYEKVLTAKYEAALELKLQESDLPAELTKKQLNKVKLLTEMAERLRLEIHDLVTAQTKQEAAPSQP